MSKSVEEYRDGLAAGRTLHAGSVMLAAAIAKAKASADLTEQRAPAAGGDHLGESANGTTPVSE